MTGATLWGKPDAGNTHVRFDEERVVLAATPRLGSLLYKTAVTVGGTLATSAQLFALAAVVAIMILGADYTFLVKGDSEVAAREAASCGAVGAVLTY